MYLQKFINKILKEAPTALSRQIHDFHFLFLDYNLYFHLQFSILSPILELI
jgi:hypothetical protein